MGGGGGLALASNGAQAARQSPQGRPPGPRVKDRARRGLGAELGVQLSVGVRDDGEGQIGLMSEELLRGGVEDHDLADARGGDFVMSLRDGAQMQAADGTAGKTPELKMNQLLSVRDGNPLARDSDQLAFGDDIPRRDSRSLLTI